MLFLMRTDGMLTSMPGRCPDALYNKLAAMNSSPACIICFHISYARPSSLRNTRACSRLTEQPCSLASRNTYEIVISAITRSRSFFSVMTPTPLFPWSAGHHWAVFSSIIPHCRAMVTAWARSFAPSLESMLETWFLTVVSPSESLSVTCVPGCVLRRAAMPWRKSG